MRIEAPFQYSRSQSTRWPLRSGEPVSSRSNLIMMPVPLAFCIPFACTVDGIGEDNRVWGSDFPHPDERLAPLDQAGDAR